MEQQEQGTLWELWWLWRRASEVKSDGSVQPTGLGMLYWVATLRRKAERGQSAALSAVLEEKRVHASHGVWRVGQAVWVGDSLEGKTWNCRAAFSHLKLAKKPAMDFTLPSLSLSLSCSLGSVYCRVEFSSMGPHRLYPKSSPYLQSPTLSLLLCIISQNEELNLGPHKH